MCQLIILRGGVVFLQLFFNFIIIHFNLVILAYYDQIKLV